MFYFDNFTLQNALSTSTTTYCKNNKLHPTYTVFHNIGTFFDIFFNKIKYGNFSINKKVTTFVCELTHYNKNVQHFNL